MKKLLSIIIAGTMIFAISSCASSSSDNMTDTKPTESSSQATKTYPSRDISIVVPFNPGGSTDLTTRALTIEMAKNLNTNMNVSNTAGASGSVGSSAVLNGKNDGYTILANGMLAFNSMQVMETLDTNYKDWDFWLATFTPDLVSVEANSKYQTMDDLLADLKANPDKITCGTAGPGSAGDITAAIISTYGEVKIKTIPYGGGAPAITATLSKEVDFTTQMLVEENDMILAKKLRPLAAMTPEDVTLPDGTVIPSILKFLPNIKTALPMGETTGLCIPKGAPDDVIAAIDKSFAEAVKTESFKAFCDSKSMEIVGYGREESQEFLKGLNSVVAWTLFDGGVAKKSPEMFNIPKP